MKTLKIFIILCLISVFIVNPIKAQNGVIKTEFTFSVNGQMPPCMGEYIGGDVVGEMMIMRNNLILKIKKAVVLGYSDKSCTNPSGNVYEISQVAVGLVGLSAWESILHARLNGKLISEIHFLYHVTTDSNGDIIVLLDKTTVNCK